MLPNVSVTNTAEPSINVQQVKQRWDNPQQTINSVTIIIRKPRQSQAVVCQEHGVHTVTLNMQWYYKENNENKRTFRL